VATRWLDAQISRWSDASRGLWVDEDTDNLRVAVQSGEGARSGSPTTPGQVGSEAPGNPAPLSSEAPACRSRVSRTRRQQVAHLCLFWAQLDIEG
jgi:hypothetical protein